MNPFLKRKIQSQIRVQKLELLITKEKMDHRFNFSGEVSEQTKNLESQLQSAWEDLIHAQSDYVTHGDHASPLEKLKAQRELKLLQLAQVDQQNDVSQREQMMMDELKTVHEHISNHYGRVAAKEVEDFVGNYRLLRGAYGGQLGNIERDASYLGDAWGAIYIETSRMVTQQRYLLQPIFESDLDKAMKEEVKHVMDKISKVYHVMYPTIVNYVGINQFELNNEDHTYLQNRLVEILDLDKWGEKDNMERISLFAQEHMVEEDMDRLIEEERKDFLGIGISYNSYTRLLEEVGSDQSLISTYEMMGEWWQLIDKDLKGRHGRYQSESDYEQLIEAQKTFIKKAEKVLENDERTVSDQRSTDVPLSVSPQQKLSKVAGTTRNLITGGTFFSRDPNERNIEE